MKFSLSTLAHLSRCLFPQDFYKELVKMGVSESNARVLMMCAMTPKGVSNAGHSKNILDVYQDIIAVPELVEILEQYISAWEAKFGE